MEINKEKPILKLELHDEGHDEFTICGDLGNDECTTLLVLERGKEEEARAFVDEINKLIQPKPTSDVDLEKLLKLIGDDEKIITYKIEPEKVEHDWVLDFTRNDTGNTKVYKCSKCVGVRKENEVVYYENCDEDDFNTAPCMCVKNEIRRNHYPDDEDTQESANAKKTRNAFRQQLRDCISSHLHTKTTGADIEELKDRYYNEGFKKGYDEGLGNGRSLEPHLSNKSEREEAVREFGRWAVEQDPTHFDISLIEKYFSSSEKEGR